MGGKSLLPASGDAQYLNTVRYNMMVRDKVAENDAREDLRENQRNHYAMIFASVPTGGVSAA